jgi:hypothetical protein
MASDPRSIDCIGYGAIYALHGVLATSLECLTRQIIDQGRVGLGPYLAVAEGMIATLHLLKVTPVWRDARTQFLFLAFCYRDLLESLATDDPATLRTAAAEMSEAQAVAVASLYQLAERLDVLPDTERTV